MPHYDALVLTLCINCFDVHRVLVNPGSAADLLQLPAFNQMKLSQLMLNSARRIIFGFNGTTTTAMGDITLPIQAGPVIRQVLFSVFEDLRTYNCIVGRAWLHSIKAVPSTYHQMTMLPIIHTGTNYPYNQCGAGRSSNKPSSHTTMLPIIHTGTKRRKGFGWSSPYGSHSHVATTARRPSKGGRK